MAKMCVIGLAAVLTCLSATVADAAETRTPAKTHLGLHIFGTTGQGYALDDESLQADTGPSSVLDRGNCDDYARDWARYSRARAAGVKHRDDDAEYRLRLKFGCIVREALGAVKSWDRPLEFVLFFNGGLNSQKVSTRAAAEYYQSIFDSKRYPVFMIWPTGFGETYGDALWQTRNADYVNPAQPQNWPTVITQAASDLLVGVASLPKALESSTRYLESGFEDIAVRASGAPWRVGRRETVRIDPPSGRALNVTYGDSVDDPGKERPFRHALAPLRPATMTLSEIGAAAWNNMVRRTRTSVHNIDEYAPPALDGSAGGRDCSRRLQRDPAKLKRCFPDGAGAFSRFLHWYAACANPASVLPGSDVCPVEGLKPRDLDLLRDSRLTLIGHSMGSIVINELVTAYPNLPYANIVFMAGADSVRSTSRAVVPMIERNRGCTKFYNLMLHPWNDANEITVGGIAPRGSLLEYIDHYLSPPRTVDDRTVGKWTNVAATKHLFGRSAQKWTLFQIHNRKAGDGYAPLKHGDFKRGRTDYGNFASERFWNPDEVAFAKPEKECAAPAQRRKTFFLPAR